MSSSLNSTPTKWRVARSSDGSDVEMLRMELNATKNSLLAKELELNVVRSRLNSECERADAAELKAKEAQQRLEEVESHMAEVRRANEARMTPMPELELQLEQAWSWSGRRDLADARKRVTELEEELLAMKSRALEAERQQQLLQSQLSRRQRDEEAAKELARELLEHVPTSSYENEEEVDVEENGEGGGESSPPGPRRVSVTQMPLEEEEEEEVIHIDLTKPLTAEEDDNQGDVPGLSPEMFAAMMMGAGLGRFSPKGLQGQGQADIHTPPWVQPSDDDPEGGSEEGEGEEEDEIDDGMELNSPVRLFGSSSSSLSPDRPPPSLDSVQIPSPLGGSNKGDDDTSPPESPTLLPSDVGRYSRGSSHSVPSSEGHSHGPQSGGLNSSLRGGRQPVVSMSALKEAALAQEQKERKERREAALSSIGMPSAETTDPGSSSLGAFATATAAAKAASSPSSEGQSDLNSSFGSIRHRRSAPMPSLDDIGKGNEEAGGHQPVDLIHLLGGMLGDGEIIAPRYPKAPPSPGVFSRGKGKVIPMSASLPNELELPSVNSGPFGNAKFVAMLVEGSSSSSSKSKVEDEAQEVEEEEGLESKTAAPSPSRLRNLRFDILDLLNGKGGGGDEDDEEEEEEEGDEAVEHLKSVIEELKEELLEQRAVNAGLRGDLRKLSSQASGLKAKPTEAKPPKPTSPSKPSSPVPPKEPQAPLTSGLEMDKRLALYREMLQEAFRTGTLSNEDMKDCRDLLNQKGRESLDPGTEKVILIKLQRVLVAGSDALKKLELQEALREKSVAAAGGRGGVVRGRGRRGGRRGGGGEGRLIFSAGDSVELPVSSLAFPSPSSESSSEEAKSGKQEEVSKEGGGPLLVASASPDVKKSTLHKPHKMPGGGDAGWKMERTMLLKRLADLEKELEEATLALKAARETSEGEGKGKGGEEEEEGQRFTLSMFEEKDERLDGLQKIIERSHSRAQELEERQVELSEAIERAERKEAAAQEWIAELSEEVERLNTLLQISQAEVQSLKNQSGAEALRPRAEDMAGPSTSAAALSAPRLVDNDIYEPSLDSGRETEGREMRAEVDKLKEELVKSQSWASELQAELQEQMMGAAKALGELRTSLQKQNENQCLLDVLEARYASSEIELEALRAQVDSARSESSSLRSESDALRTQLDATEAECEVLRQGLRGAVTEASAARAEAGEAAQEARELLAEGLRAAYGKGALGVGLGGSGVETSRAMSSLPNTPSSNRPILASSPLSDAATRALKSIPPPWEQNTSAEDDNILNHCEGSSQPQETNDEGEGEGGGHAEDRLRVQRLEEEKEKLLGLVASLESHVSVLERQVSTLAAQLEEDKGHSAARAQPEEEGGGAMSREERERAEQLASWRPDLDIALVLSELESLRGQVQSLSHRLEASERECEVKAQEVKAARALAYDLSNEVDALRGREEVKETRVATLLSEVDHYKADLGKVASELVQLMSDTVKLRSASATAHISAATSPSRPLISHTSPSCPLTGASAYYSPGDRGGVKGEAQGQDSSPVTLWKRRLDHAKREQEEIASELHSTRKQVLELQRQMASERAKTSIEERRQRSKEAERDVQEKEVQRRLQRLLSLVAATEGKLRVKSYPSSSSSSSTGSPLSHLSRSGGVGGGSEGHVNSGSLGLEGLARDLERRVGEVLVLALEAQGDLLIAKASSSSSSPPPSTATKYSAPPHTSAYSYRQTFDVDSGVGRKRVVAPKREMVDDEPASSSVPISPSWKPPRPVGAPAVPASALNPRASPPIDHLSLRSQAASAAYEQAFVHAASAPAISPLSSTSAASKALSEAYVNAQTASASKPSLLLSNYDSKAQLSPPTLRSASFEGRKASSSALSLSQGMESPRASKSLAELYSGFGSRLFLEDHEED